MAADDLSAPLGQHRPPKQRLALPVAVPPGGRRGAWRFRSGFSPPGRCWWTTRSAASRWWWSRPTSASPMPAASPRTRACARSLHASPSARAATTRRRRRSRRNRAPAPAPRPSPSSTAAAASARRSCCRARPTRTASESAGIDARLVETSRHGPLPKVGPDGARPVGGLCAPGQGHLPASRTPPRVAIVISGLGIGAAGTSDALGKLPPAGDLRVRALWRSISSGWSAARAATATRCCCRCRWSRSTIRTTIRARRRC